MTALRNVCKCVNRTLMLFAVSLCVVEQSTMKHDSEWILPPKAPSFVGQIKCSKGSECLSLTYLEPTWPFDKSNTAFQILTVNENLSSLHFAKGQGLNTSLNESKSQLPWICRGLNGLVYLGQSIQLMDGTKSPRIYWKHILNVVQLWPFFTLYRSAKITKVLLKIRNNNHFCCWNSHMSKKILLSKQSALFVDLWLFVLIFSKLPETSFLDSFYHLM